MKRILTVGLFLLLFGITVSGQRLTYEEYTIYSKVINAFLKSEKVKGRKVILERESENEIEMSPDVFWDSTIVKLSNKLTDTNRDQISFGNNFELRNYKLIVVPREEINALFSKDIDKGWKDFYKTYHKPGGLVRISKMYLEPNMTQGLIYISISRGGLNGAGYLIYFDLNDKRIIKAKQGLWVS